MSQKIAPGVVMFQRLYHQCFDVAERDRGYEYMKLIEPDKAELGLTIWGIHEQRHQVVSEFAFCALKAVQAPGLELVAPNERCLATFHEQIMIMTEKLGRDLPEMSAMDIDIKEGHLRQVDFLQEAVPLIIETRHENLLRGLEGLAATKKLSRSLSGIALFTRLNISN